LQHNPGATIDPFQLQMEVIRHEMDALKALDEQVKSDLAAFQDIVDQCVDMEEWSAMTLFIDRFQEILDTQELSPGHRNMIEDAIEDAGRAMESAKPSRRRRR
jgi:DNA-binding transcriptional regulator PaaX